MPACPYRRLPSCIPWMALILLFALTAIPMAPTMTPPGACELERYQKDGTRGWGGVNGNAGCGMETA